MAARGAHTTVATADLLSLEQTTCEMCGGCISVCPTGAMFDKTALQYHQEHGGSHAELDVVRTTCNFCGVGCQLDLHVDRGVAPDAPARLAYVTAPPPGTTVNDGNLCVKGRFANDFVHHAERLTTPLVRNAEGALVPASWDEALDRAAEGLRAVEAAHGADSLAFVSSSRCTVEENYLVQKWARAGFRTHNVHQCAAT
jgi:predicted molibdopterin-dependent oxidoreductase YjgC